MSDLYVLQPDGTRFGPLTKDAIARGIVDGTIAQDAYLAPPGAPQWFHASQLPAVTALVESLRRRSSVPPPRAPSHPPRPSSPGRPAALRATLESPIAPIVKDAPRTEAQVASALQTQPQPAVMEQLAAMTLVSSQPPAAMRSALAAARAAQDKTPEAPRAEAAPPETKVAPSKPAAQPASPKGPWPKWLPFGIFGAFAFLALVEVIVAAVSPPAAGGGEPTQSVETKR